MDIKSYLHRYPDDLQRLADKSGTKPIYLRQIAWGHRQPSHKLAKAIQQATDGEITVHDLRPDIFGPPSSPVTDRRTDDRRLAERRTSA